MNFTLLKRENKGFNFYNNEAVNSLLPIILENGGEIAFSIFQRIA